MTAEGVRVSESRSAAHAMAPLKVLIASRIFEPEPSAASFRLGALAEALAAADHEVVVLTSRPPAVIAKNANDKQRSYRVKRFPVLRDRSGFVRGYLPYLSFDIPLFFRVLLGRKVDVIVVEPPPTTGLFVRLAASLRRTPYVYYAADIWADGAAQTGIPDWIVRAVGTIERFALRGAKTVLSVSASLTDRLAEINIAQNVITVGNGVDSRPFCSGHEKEGHYRRVFPHEFVYAGTASEWHGSTIFIEALPIVLAEVPEVKVRFIGGGSEFQEIEVLASKLGLSKHLSLEPFMPPSALAPILRGATAALASILPGNGNEFTFPTKLYASTLCGIPAVFAGVGPAVQFLETELQGVPLGLAVGLDPSEVAEAMLQMIAAPQDFEHRSSVAQWGIAHVSLAPVAEKIVLALEKTAR